MKYHWLIPFVTVLVFVGLAVLGVWYLLDDYPPALDLTGCSYYVDCCGEWAEDNCTQLSGTVERNRVPACPEGMEMWNANIFCEPWRDWPQAPMTATP